MLNYTYGGNTKNGWPALGSAVVIVRTYFKLCMSKLHVLEVEMKRNVLTKIGSCPGCRAVRTDDFRLF